MTGADVKGAAEEDEAVTGLWLDGEAVAAEEGEAVTGLWLDGRQLLEFLKEPMLQGPG